MSTAKTLQAIKFNKDTISLEILDQLLLPYSTTYIPISSIEDAFQAIKSMQVRGAPAIAIVGAFAVLVEAHTQKRLQNVKPIGELIQSIEYLITSRPTAVNLANALNEIRDLILKNYKTDQLLDQGVVDIIFNYSVALYEDDLENNFKIGDNGLKYIVDTLVRQNFKGPFSIMTICNTGSLATSGHGTALGIIRSTFKSLQKESGSHDFWLDQVYPCETRPYNQGAKLTTYELKYEEIPFVLICDNMVTSLINTLNVQKKPIKNSTAPVKFIVAGADRVVKNGDSANKIGTYQLATIANQFNSRLSSDESIKFIIAAPNTTIDLNTKSGEDIVIEERPSNELTTIKGPVLTQSTTTNQVDVGDKYTIGIATPDISVWNPAFDVTPHDLIDAIVTEEAAIIKQNGEFKLSK